MLNSNKPIMILFRMQTCPHCVAMKDAWEQAKLALSKENGLQVAEVEYEYMNMLPPSLQNIRGFPTLQIIENKKVKNEYFGDRSFESILDFGMANAKKEVKAAPKKSAPAPKKKAAPKKKNSV